MSKHGITLQVSEDDCGVAYVYLPEHPDSGIYNVVSKHIRLRELIQDYKGPDIYLDFSHDGTLIGIEILA